MHKYTMDIIGDYIQKNYNPETMTACDLKDLYYLSGVFNNLLEGDYHYTIIKSMNEGESNNPMSYEEFLNRFEKMYKTADPNTKMMIDAEIKKAMM